MNTSELFPPELLTAAGRWRFRSERGGEPLSAGRHSSPCPGDSGEFQDFRNYTPGDDLRRVDWNIYRRHRKLLVRRYRDFPRKRHLLILDASRSVRCRPARALTAWRLTALLGGMMLGGGDRVQLRVSGIPGEAVFAAGQGAFPALLEMLTRAWRGPEAAPSWNFAPEAGTHVWVISDFLDPEGLDHLEEVLRRSPGFTPVRIYEPEEEHPELTAAVRLVDAESGAAVAVAPDPGWAERYREQLRRFHAALELPARRGETRVYGFDATRTLTEQLRQAAEAWVEPA